MDSSSFSVKFSLEIKVFATQIGTMGTILQGSYDPSTVVFISVMPFDTSELMWEIRKHVSAIEKLIQYIFSSSGRRKGRHSVQHSACLYSVIFGKQDERESPDAIFPSLLRNIFFLITIVGVGKQTEAECENRDLINKLPDLVLSYILSFLKIKDAVDSSMISHRWRHLWKHLILTRRNLEFDILNIFGGKYAQLITKHEHNLGLLVEQFERQYFVRRVHEFLRLYSGKKVDTFKVAFYLDGEYSADLDEWIRFAFEKGAQVLDLQLFRCIIGTNKLYVFPHQLLLSDSSLNHLSLLRCVLKPPSDFDRFNQLTTLDLRSVILDENFTACLFSNCLFLERLTLVDCTVGSFLIITGHPHLTDLKVLWCDKLEKIEICAANLVSLEYDGKIVISCIKTPRLARLLLCEGSKGTLPHGLTQFASCPGLESLYLILRNESEQIPQSVLTFRNLKQMSLILRPWNFELGSVLNILKAAPLLEEFEIMVLVTCNRGEMSNLSGFSHNHLRNVQIHGFHGRSSEIELAICILKIATKLEKMVINPLGKFYEGDSRWVGIDPYYCSDEDDYEDDNLDEYGVPHAWKQRGRARVREKLKVVMTDAQVAIL